VYHIWDNANDLFSTYMQSKSNNNSPSNILKLEKSIRRQTYFNALLYLIPVCIGLVYVYRGKIKTWKFNAILACSVIGIIFCLPTIIVDKNLFSTIFTSTAVTLMPCYFLGITLLTKSARRLR